MTKKYLGLLAVGAALAMCLSPVSTEAATSIHTVWEATKLLTINVNNNPGTELGTAKKKFAIGPAEWRMTLQENGGTTYTSTWSLPVLPGCYNLYTSCTVNTQMARDFLWAVAMENDRAHESWTFERVVPDHPDLFVENHGYAWGQGVLGGINNDNTNNISVTGAYGWAHGKYESGNGGTITKAGAMIPLHWRVEGNFQ